MKKATIRVKGKDSLGREFIVPVEYSEPTTWAEACKMDGETKAFKTFLNERKTSFMDRIRTKEKTKRDESLKKGLSDPQKAAKIQAILDS